MLPINISNDNGNAQEHYSINKTKDVKQQQTLYIRLSLLSTRGHVWREEQSKMTKGCHDCK